MLMTSSSMHLFLAGAGVWHRPIKAEVVAAPDDG
jgi:hypothetical protein